MEGSTSGGSMEAVRETGIKWDGEVHVEGLPLRACGWLDEEGARSRCIEYMY